METQQNNSQTIQQPNNNQPSQITDEEKKPKGKYYCVEAEKRFPKIRIAQSDYDRLKIIQQEYNYKSLGQVITRLINTYHKLLFRSKKQTNHNHQKNSSQQKKLTISKKMQPLYIQQQ